MAQWPVGMEASKGNKNGQKCTSKLSVCKGEEVQMLRVKTGHLQDTWRRWIRRQPHSRDVRPRGIKSQGKPTSSFSFLTYFYFLATMPSIQDLSSLTRGQTSAPCSGSAVCTTGPEGKSPNRFLSKQFIESAMTPREEKIMDQKAE